MIAALIHVQIVVMVGVLAYFNVPRRDDLADAIDITALGEEASREITAELERQAAAEETKQEEEKKKEEEKVDPERQVVEVPNANDEAPKESRFAAERDSAVERETHRKGVSEPRPMPAPSQPSLLAMRPPSPPSRAPGAMGVPGASPEPPISGQDPETESLPRPGVEAAPGGPPTRPSEPGSPALIPTQQTLARALGSGTSDYLADIDEGEDTALNAKKWKFASFFNRVKEQIRQHWHAAQEYAKRDPTGSLYGGRVRFTVLIVQLKPDGSLADVQLEKGSGVDFLDDVAVDAVKEAQPFPNPPQQLIDKNLGKISFRFGFVVDVEGETRLKVYRYSSM